MYLGEFVSAFRVSLDAPTTWGWRIWRLVRDPLDESWLLASSSHDYRWLSPIVCNGGPPKPAFSPDDIVANGSDAGFFSFKARAIARRSLNAPRDTKQSFALGVVQNLGTVMEHEFGYRAQGVFVTELEIRPALADAPAIDEMRTQLIERYRCGVRSHLHPVTKPAEAPVLPQAAKRLRMALGMTGLEARASSRRRDPSASGSLTKP